MKQGMSNILIPSFTAVMGASAVGLVFLHHLKQERKNNESTLLALKAKHAEEVNSLESTNREHLHALNKTHSEELTALKEEKLQITMSNMKLCETEASLLCALNEQHSVTAVVRRSLEESTTQKNEAVRELGQVRKENAQLTTKSRELTVQKELAETEWSKSFEEANRLQNVCEKLQDDVDHFKTLENHSRRIIAKKAQQISSYVANEKSLQKDLAEKEKIIEYQEQELASAKQRSEENQASLDGYGCYLREIQCQHQNQLERCAEEILSLRTERDNTYRELKSFLQRHPELDIEIALAVRKDLQHLFTSSSSSSG